MNRINSCAAAFFSHSFYPRRSPISPSLFEPKIASKVVFGSCRKLSKTFLCNKTCQRLNYLPLPINACNYSTWAIKICQKKTGEEREWGKKNKWLAISPWSPICILWLAPNPTMLLAKEIHFGKTEIQTRMWEKYKLKYKPNTGLPTCILWLALNPTLLLLARKNTCEYTKRYKHTSWNTRERWAMSDD